MTAGGLLLAAGAGRRMGGPKALVELGGEPLVRRALRVLEAGGCGPLTVVVGAEAQRAAALVGDRARVVVAEDWAEGMGASLRAGLAAVADGAQDAVVVHLVDLPGVTPEAVARLAALGSPSALARAAYAGVPAHPVLLGRTHWAAVAAQAHGDQGARAYLKAHPVTLVECGDVASPEDVDTPEALAEVNLDTR
ncbi:nucleotidyltransferase family protein [Pseudonocardia oroxyli]|uniref:Nicotine blue oxidoreductase n=1 Tax=Pseudonocardia oroxyli TaxID=366584 RepID=A0A1G7FLZ0_PSEOR|nr:nucleotidyltransferase family protein [Pseudonocardia oroxyli]SDE76922.1 nicotine blue oxidoreductase [Pseudonocardia oroxyli]